MQSADAENADDRTEDICLLEIEIDEISSFALDVLDRLFYVDRL